MKKDEDFLKQAVRLAVESIEKGAGPFGSIVVHEGKIIGRGTDEVISRQDPTAHSEIRSIQQACQSLQSHDLSTCILYSSCQPCSMCSAAIAWSGIKRVDFAASRADAENYGFIDPLLDPEFSVFISALKVEFNHYGLKEALDPFKKLKS